jgi:hypothetical protein
MSLGKFIVTHDPYYTYEFPTKFEAFVHSIVLCDCCGPVGAELQGPKGSYDLSNLKSDLGDDLVRIRIRNAARAARSRVEQSAREARGVARRARARAALLIELAQARAKVKQLEARLDKLTPS